MWSNYVSQGRRHNEDEANYHADRTKWKAAAEMQKCVHACRHMRTGAAEFRLMVNLGHGA